MKTQNRVASYKNTENSSIVTKKKLGVYNNSPQDKHVASKLRNSSTARCNQFSEYQNVNEGALLDMYTSTRDNNKLVASPKEKAKENSGSENTSPDLFKRRNPFVNNVSELASPPGENLLLENASPELCRQKNPFVKHVTELVTSPSILSDENCRRRGRNLMRIRRTIIDEDTVVESKYFSKQNNENGNDLKNEGIEENSLKSTKCNLTSKMGVDALDDGKNNLEQTEILSIANHVENVNLKEDTNNVTFSRDEYSSEYACENTYEKLQPSNDESYVPDNVAAAANYNAKPDDEPPDYYENITSLRENFSRWSNTTVCQTPPRTTEDFREQTSANSVNTKMSIQYTRGILKLISLLKRDFYFSRYELIRQ